MTASRQTARFSVYGMVQGIGYRPFVCRLCDALGLVGFVQNSGGIVRLTATGTPSALTALEEKLKDTVPPGGVVFRVARKPLPLLEFETFSIQPSGEEVEEFP